MEGKTIKGLIDQTPDIPRKPKKAPAPETDGAVQTNGEKHDLDADAPGKDLKRARPDESDEPLAKKAKTTATTDDDDIVVVDEGGDGGAIVIDD